MNMENKVTCDLCPIYCKISEGSIGLCKARSNIEGKIVSLSYGKVIAIDLDPIEKKPLKFFYPGSKILSVGTFGCNMACPFCQNYQIARAGSKDLSSYDISPENLIDIALNLKERGNIGIAFTYNEPTINFEYVKDTFVLAKKAGLETVLVTNGQINEPYLKDLIDLTKAWNIDLKSFSKKVYKSLGGDLPTTLNTIEKVSKFSHLEITSLIVPGISDNLEDFKKEVDFISGINPKIPLHLSRYFPAYKYKEEATSLELMKKMKKIAEEKLKNVVLGNVW